MLYLIVVWIGLTLACYLAGLALLHGFGADWLQRPSDRAIAALWLGVVALAVSLLAVSLLFPLSPLVGGSVLLVWSGAAWLIPGLRHELRHGWQQLNKNWMVIFAAISLAAAAIISRPITWVDTGLYHYSVLQWLSRFGTVPGLALLLSNLGFTSSWFAFAAPFNPPVLGARAAAVANGFVLLLLLLQACISLQRCLQPRDRPSDWFLLLFSLLLLPLLLGFRLLFEILVSPSPDLPVTVLTGILAWLVLLAADAKKGPFNQSIPAAAVPLFFASGIVTIKLVALPLLAVTALFYLAQTRGQGRALWQGVVVVTVVLAPMMLASTITSGCPLYPSTRLCLNLPWSPEAASIKITAQKTHGWTSWYGAPPEGANPLLWLIGKWLTDAKVNQVLALVVTSLAAGWLLSLRRWQTSEFTGWGWVGAISAGGLTFLAGTAPFFRFAIAYVLVATALLLALHGRHYWLALQSSLRESRRHLFRVQFLAWLCCFFAALIWGVYAGQEARARLILPPPLRQVAVVEHRVNDWVYRSPAGDLCWATEIPCAFDVPDTVRLRSPENGLADGFIRVPQKTADSPASN